MPFKAPLPTALPPTPSPSSHIRRYLSSLPPYYHEHVTEGQERVAHERENGFQVFQDYKASGDSSSAGNWSEAIYRQRREEEGGRQELNKREHDGQGELARGVLATGNLRRAAAVHGDKRGKLGLSGMKGKAKAGENKEEESGSETSSAERRAQRKQRRREKKAMRRPPPPTLPPQPIATKRPATNPLGSEVSVGSFMLPPVKRRKGKVDGMDMVRRFEASNVAVKRLTLRPGKGTSMFGRGPTSAPVRPARRTSVPVEPSSQSRDHGYMDAWRRKPLGTAPNHRERKEQADALVPPSSEGPCRPVRGSAVTPQPDSGPLQTKATNTINKLPPPGRTDSSPWPSEIIVSGRKDQLASQHSRRHSDGVLGTVPQPLQPHFAPESIRTKDPPREQHQVRPTTTDTIAQVDQASKQPVSFSHPIIHKTDKLSIARSGSYGVDHLMETFGQSMKLRREESQIRYTPSISSSRYLPVLNLFQRRSAPTVPAADSIIRLHTTNLRDAPPYQPLIIPQHTSPSVWSGPSSIRQPIHIDHIHPAHSPTAHLKIAEPQASPLIKLEAFNSPYSVIGLPSQRRQISPSLPQDIIPKRHPPPEASLDQLFTPPSLQYTPAQPVSRPIILDPTDDNPFLSHGNPFLVSTHPHSDIYYMQDPLVMVQDSMSSPYPSIPETDLPILFDSEYDILSAHERYNPHSESGRPDPMQAEAEHTWRNFWKDRPAAI